MGLGSFTKKVIRESPFAFVSLFILTTNNTGAYFMTKYDIANADNPKVEAQRALDVYKNYSLAKSVAFGSYLAARQELDK